MFHLNNAHTRRATTDAAMSTTRRITIPRATVAVLLHIRASALDSLAIRKTQKLLGMDIIIVTW